MTPLEKALEKVRELVFKYPNSEYSDSIGKVLSYAEKCYHSKSPTVLIKQKQEEIQKLLKQIDKLMK
jgi:hypothetical protein